MFPLRPVVGGPSSLPISYLDSVDLPATADAVFSVLGEIGSWDRWFTGMRRVRIDGPASGVGALRTVWVGATSVQERFDRWEPGVCLGLQMTLSSLPGLARMAEEWRLIPTGATTCRLDIAVGLEPRAALRPLGALVRAGVRRATSGGSGIASMFATP